VSPNASAPQPAAERPTEAATEKAASEISDLAVVPLPDLFQRLHSTDSGLSTSDAAAVLKTVGPNQVKSTKPKGLVAAFVERFSNPLVLILLFAAAVSAFTG